MGVCRAGPLGWLIETVVSGQYPPACIPLFLPVSWIRVHASYSQERFSAIAKKPDHQNLLQKFSYLSKHRSSRIGGREKAAPVEFMPALWLSKAEELFFSLK